jgi:glycosyltransferase involved in cell wall biosynthesis
MRIGIFETDHFEGAYPIIRLFDNGQNEITIFTYEEPYRQFQFLFGEQINRYQWIVKEKEETRYHFMHRLYRETRARQIDLLYMNTISNNHLFYAWLIRRLGKTRIITTLHDINSYFHFKPAFNLRRWIRYIGKRWFIRSVQEFNVVSDTMVDHLKSKLPAHKKVYSLPGAVYEMAAPPVCPLSGTIQIVVPGTVDGRRRHYEIVFELLDACNKQAIPVAVILLGGFYGEYGQMILEKCRQYTRQHSNLQYYETKLVDQPEFDRVMNEAHLVFTPTVIHTILFDGIVETYGQSISSGNLFDIIKHAKPFIAPAVLTIPDRLKSSCVPYHNVDDIIALLKKILQDRDYYDQLTKNAEQNSLQYTIEKVRERNRAVFEAKR